MELSLDLGVHCLPKPLSEFLLVVSRIDDCSSSLSEIHGFVGRLEEERRKIDAFKRELPLSMLLLNEAISRLKLEAMRSSERRDGSPMEGSVASNRKFDDGEGTKVENDKKDWMSSAQLWISKSDSHSQSREEEEEDRSVPQNQFLNCNVGDNGGAFLPFMRPYRNYHHHRHHQHVPPPPLTLLSPASDMVVDCRVDHRQLSKPLSQHQMQKKEQRRRWSPDLHRKFIDALQRLGGSQVATPKQIRELMKVEGLTNDEVKSHLQKYRIHIRKHPIFQAAESAKTAGGSDRIPCEDKESESRSVSESDSPQGPLARRGFSSTGDHSSDSAEGEEDEEAKSDGQSR